jgi:SAM-dependent methyltransferase
MTWVEYWSADSSVYVSERHKQVHYEGVARDIAANVPARDARVVDYGCGEALSSGIIVDACGQLFLCDGSDAVRARLAKRFAQRSNISVISPGEFERLPNRSIDLIVANSVVQYLSPAELERLLSLARAKLAPSGQLVLADIIPRNVGAITDATELLRFAAANGFFVAALAGLVRSFFSKYRHVRATLGLLRLDEGEALRMLEQSGFTAHRHHPNIGHNQKRMAFVASPSPLH